MKVQIPTLTVPMPDQSKVLGVASYLKGEEDVVIVIGKDPEGPESIVPSYLTLQNTSLELTRAC